ncbi:lytic murein transglycosylase B [Oleiagrimonas sp.]|jgi:membrane-bound lytic murein transglycosylase B|uniref:lytic murein transglycosylase B n=1 Tax=Oleiagrimonas sp. TaxID=2010330 RepID=UPI00262632AC|nr:lytic murein transglycosylase B [Oleiagrimonas sp.]MDA3914295.1 lytic murein transglycosylase B [Oleiagrimonas sp.]
MSISARLYVLLAALALCLPWRPARAEVHPGEAALVREVAADTGKSPARLTALLDQAKKQQSILDAIARPAESMDWKNYRPIFLTPSRIQDGIEFYRKHRALIDATADKYGVDPQYLVAILGVETRYGSNTGHYKVLDALVTLAFYYPPRAAFFRKQLKILLELPASKLAGPLDTLTGSYAGAQGWGQFMPSSIKHYAVDADHDGHIDLYHSLPDILASVANYFHAHGWKPDEGVAAQAQPMDHPDPIKYLSRPPSMPLEDYESRGYAPLRHIAPGMPANLLTLQAEHGPQYWFTFQNFYVITRYNSSPLYAMAIRQLANAIAAGVHDPAAQEVAP